VHEVELEDDTGTDTGVCEMASVIQEGGLEGKARQGPVPAGGQRAGVLLCEVRGIGTIGTTKKSQAADLARNVADSSPLSRLDPSKKNGCFTNGRIGTARLFWIVLRCWPRPPPIRLLEGAERQLSTAEIASAARARGS